MRTKRNIFLLLSSLFIISTLLLSWGVNKTGDRGDQEYEAQIITLEGLPDGNREVSLSELRTLPQYYLDASYKRTTGLQEEFKMSGPFLADVLSYVGANISDYEGIGVQGRDSYYCLLSAEVIKATPDLMLALTIDGKAKLEEGKAPAQLGVQGQLGPYWVKMVDKIILYKEVPKKEITSVWVFDNLAEGIVPYEYEYYGSKDAAIDLEQIFSRMDKVDSKAFFTMKSSDGFKKNEALNIVKSRYYIKTEGADAPTNISPYIKLGMNVKNIAWISTNADAAIFPHELAKYMDLKEIEGKKGIPLSEILYETEVEQLSGITFHVLGTAGEKQSVSGEDLSRGILTIEQGKYSVIWEESLGLENIDNLMRLRAVPLEPPSGSSPDIKETGIIKTEESNPGLSTKTEDADEPKKDVVLTIKGDGVKKVTQWSLTDLKMMTEGYGEFTYSILNNWPAKKFFVGKGITLEYLLKESGMSDDASSFKITASDGFHATLTREQLLGDQFFYPNFLKDSSSGAEKTKTLLAWSWKEGTDNRDQAQNESLRLLVGQKSLRTVNSSVTVKNVAEIQVLTLPPHSWPAPMPNIPEGKVAAGTGISFKYDFLDQVRIHYTLDGSDPTYDSNLYNPSTTYFQPDLIAPIIIKETTALKVLVTGWGKNDSKIESFTYIVE